MTTFACDMSAIPPEEREDHYRTLGEVFGAVEEIGELPNGFVFKLPDDVQEDAERFIARERLCCPFFRFALDVAPLRLTLTGPEGVKPFIQAEIGGALDRDVARQIGF